MVADWPVWGSEALCTFAAPSSRELQTTVEYGIFQRLFESGVRTEGAAKEANFGFETLVRQICVGSPGPAGDAHDVSVMGRNRALRVSIATLCVLPGLIRGRAAKRKPARPWGHPNEFYQLFSYRHDRGRGLGLG